MKNLDCYNYKPDFKQFLLVFYPFESTCNFQLTGLRQKTKEEL